MKTISRDHLFENRITLVNQMETLYGIHHEKDGVLQAGWSNAATNPITVKRTPELDAAFEAHNWEAFEAAEASELGGKATA